ncbi:unnamed protein product [Urochloa humidicola]
MDDDGGSSTARTGAGAAAGVQRPQRPSWRPRLVAFASTATTSSTSGTSLSTTYTSGSSHLQSSSSGNGGLTPPVALSSLHAARARGRKGEHEQVHHVPRSGIHGRRRRRRCRCSGPGEVLLGSGHQLGPRPRHKRQIAGRFLSFIFPRRLGDLARSWIDALTVINLSMFMCFNGQSNQEDGAFSSVPTISEFAQFIQSTLLKMLSFADAVMSRNVTGPCIQHNLLSTNSGDAAVPAEKKLQALLGVRHALSVASELFQLWFSCSLFEGSSRAIIEQTSSVLSAELAKLDEAVWDTLDEVRTSITPMMDDHNAADSPDIHKATRSIVNCINFISPNYALVHEIVSKAASLGKYVPQDNIFSHPLTANPLAMLIREMLSLQENLARVSQPFPDQSLRFLFLLNNTHLMWQQLNHRSCDFQLHVQALAHKIDEHIQRYLEMSWIPVVSGLHDSMPLCLGRYSRLAKFELEFQKTYTVQKLWKVPDPELRTRLRKAIIETVIPVFTKHVADNKITAPRVTQQELEDMLQLLFEG